MNSEKTYKVAVTGHQPPKLGGNQMYPWNRPAIQQHMRLVLDDIHPGGRHIETITGMAQGIDQDWAQACVDMRVPFHAAVPFVGQQMKWPPIARNEYSRLLHAAHTVQVVGVGDTTHQKLLSRNRWMVDQADELVAYWDGTKSSGTWHCLQVAESLGLRTRVIRVQELGLAGI